MMLDKNRESIWAAQEALFLGMLQDSSGESELCPAVKHQVLSGGKRLRALLPVLVQQSLTEAWKRTDKEDAQRALWSGLAVELLHSATLCHDDVMDGDRLRRDQPTVWVQYGIPQAINAGDLLFFLARDAVARAPFHDADKLRALSFLSQSISHVIQGQALETTLRKQNRAPDLQTYEAIARGKTGGLFALCLILGAISVEAPASALQTLAEIGEDLGWIFQVQDDLIDLIGEKGRGTQDNDLREGKPSWLVAACCGRMDPEGRAAFLRTLYKARNKKSEADVRHLRDQIAAAGVVDQGMNALEERAQSLSTRLASQLPELQPLVSGFTGHFLSPLRSAYEKKK